MGPGILLKAVFQGSFSLMVFGWAQIIMDIQPLLVMLSGHGHLHGFSHTYIGATLLAILSALSGKYLSEIGLFILGLNRNWRVNIAWWVCFVSAFIGTYSHVLLDSVMHIDVTPFWPLSTSNKLQGIISISMLYQVCLYSAAAGGVLYFVIDRVMKRNRQV